MRGASPLSVTPQSILIQTNPPPSSLLPPALFAYVLYPNRHNLHLEQFAPSPTDNLPYVRNLLRYWIFSAYYIVSELWGSVRASRWIGWAWGWGAAVAGG